MFEIGCKFIRIDTYCVIRVEVYKYNNVRM